MKYETQNSSSPNQIKIGLDISTIRLTKGDNIQISVISTQISSFFKIVIDLQPHFELKKLAYISNILESEKIVVFRIYIDTCKANGCNSLFPKTIDRQATCFHSYIYNVVHENLYIPTCSLQLFSIARYRGFLLL